MRAAVYHGRHDIRIESVPEPPGRAAGEVVLEVLRSAICGTDSSEWSHGPLLARPPVILGHEFVGRVIEVGDVGGPTLLRLDPRQRPSLGAVEQQRGHVATLVATDDDEMMV